MKWTENILNPLHCDNPDPRWVEPKLPDFQLIQSLAREVGYSVGIHGSLKRDVDLIAVPWADDAKDWMTLVDNLCHGLNAKWIGDMERKPFGRIAVTLQIDGYYKQIDLSITPKVST